MATLQYTYGEGAVVTVKIIEAATSARYSWSNFGGTATYGVDYTFSGGSSGSITNPPVGYTFTFTILPDTIIDPGEFFTFTLDEVENGFPDTTEVRVNIIDATPAALQASVRVGTIPTAGNGAVTIPIIVELNRAPGTTGPVQVVLGPAFGSDAAGSVSTQFKTDWFFASDENANSMVVQFAANETTKTINVTFKDDDYAHARAETFRVALSNPSTGLAISSTGGSATANVPFATSNGGAIITYDGLLPFEGYRTQLNADIQAAIAQISRDLPGGLPSGIRVKVVEDQALGANVIAAATPLFVERLVFVEGYVLPRYVMSPGALDLYKTGQAASELAYDIELHLNSAKLLEFYSGRADQKTPGAPANYTFDAKTILIHELLHGLGFGAQVPGDSRLGATPSLWGKYIVNQRVGDPSFGNAYYVKDGNNLYGLGPRDEGSAARFPAHYADSTDLMYRFYVGQDAAGPVLSAADIAALQILGYKAGNAYFAKPSGQAQTAAGYLSNILRGGDNDTAAALLVDVSEGRKTADQARADIVKAADPTTSVATMSYQFFTGRVPSEGGIDYLVSPFGPNANNINAAYYQSFSQENRYINFAVNLGKEGEGKAAFEAKYGAMDLAAATKEAYRIIFGTTPTDQKVRDLLDPSFVLAGMTMTRAEYFAYYGRDGANGVGTKAAMVGWLLGEAEKADVGTMARSNAAFLTDLADGANFAVDIVGVYGRPEFAI